MILEITNECDLSKVDAPFSPILPRATGSYLRVLGEAKVLNIRLMGSVPRGDARIGHSDIDFVAICGSPPTAAELAHLATESAVLSAEFPQVRNVDLEWASAIAMDAGREFVFRTDSVSIYGTDLFPEKITRKEASEIAAQNTPELAGLVQKYASGLRDSTSESEILQFSRWIGKDCLKAFRKRLLLEKSIYVRTASDIHRELLKYYPEHHEVLDALLAAYKAPTSDVAVLEGTLQKVRDVGAFY